MRRFAEPLILGEDLRSFSQLPFTQTRSPVMNFSGSRSRKPKTGLDREAPRNPRCPSIA